MYSKWIKSGFILAILLVSMVSLSMAACPWLIKNELYSAQCGVIKEVPASAGILANDPGAVAVLNPESITIDAKYGTLDVNADGSFVYDPSPDMQSGTYVTFKYGATNGACAATVMGTAKIQVACKCRPQLANITLCLPTTLADIKAALEEAGADCLGCGATATIFDLSKIVLAPGRYPYLLKCPGCQAVVGYVTLIPGCTAVAPDFEFCEGTVTLDQLEVQINSRADCIGVGCDQSPVINTENVTVAGGFVTGGSYTATCGAGTECADTDTGIITVFQKCEVVAPPIEICEGRTLAQLLVEINTVADCTGEDCDATPVVNTDNVTVVGGLVTGGSYKITCTVAPNCESSATGTITVVQKCEVVAPPIEICEGRTLAQLLVEINTVADCTGEDCDATPVVNTDNVTVVGGLVTGGSYKVTCTVAPNCESSATGTISVVNLCTVRAPDVEICPGSVTLDELKDMIMAAGSLCTGENCDATPEIDTTNVIVENGFVAGGSYAVICTVGPDCKSSARGNIILLPPEVCQPPCPCEAVAPPIEICPNEVTLADLKEMINAVADCVNLEDAECDATPQIDTTGVKVTNGFVTSGSYKVTCPSDIPDCTREATGQVTLRTDCCQCTATAPDICLPIICFGHNCHTYTYGEILAEVIAKGGKCKTGCTMALEIPDIKWNFPGVYTYKVICTKAGCTEGEATGKLTVTWKCPDCKTCCKTC